MTTHNRDKVIAAAKESGIHENWNADDWYSISPAQLELLYTIAYEDGRVAEREECAKVCEGERLEDSKFDDDRAYNMAIKHCAQAIRARGDM